MSSLHASPRTMPLSLVAWWRNADQFFFAKDVPYGLAIIRFLLPLTLMANLWRRWPWVREVFSTDGAPAPLADNFGYPHFLPEFSGTVAVALYALMLLAMISMSVGWMTRISVILTGGLYYYFAMLDCVSTMTKYTVIVTHVMLLLAISPCGAVWSVDAWIRNRGQLRQPWSLDRSQLMFSIWPQRLVQILIGVVYIGAAITKMHTPTFFSGDQLMYWMMTHIMSPTLMGDLLSQYPVLLSVFGYITIIWEVAFVFCVWFNVWRLPMLLIGAVFHVMTILTLGLLVFPAVMITLYMSFLTEQDVQWVSSVMRRMLRKSDWVLRWHSRMASRRSWWINAPLTGWTPRRQAFAYALVMGFLTMAAVEWEYRRDLYHERTAGGPLPLKEMDPELVKTMIGPETPLREKDKILALDMGTFMVGEHLVDRRREFKAGDHVIVQASLNPPREDLWLECDLVDADQRTIARSGQIAPREIFRSNFEYWLPRGMEPGQYEFVLKSSGKPVTRRKLTVVGAVKTAQAAPAASPVLGN